MKDTTMNSNQNRAERAKQTLRYYIEETRKEVFECLEYEASDLIADLLHWAHQSDPDADPFAMLEMAKLHYDAEISDPEESADDETRSITFTE